jgi:hypothetical protein
MMPQAPAMALNRNSPRVNTMVHWSAMESLSSGRSSVNSNPPRAVTRKATLISPAEGRSKEAMIPRGRDVAFAVEKRKSGVTST